MVDYDLTVDAGDALVSAHIIVDEGAPVIAGEIDLSVSQNSTSPERLPIATKERRRVRSVSVSLTAARIAFAPNWSGATITG